MPALNHPKKHPRIANLQIKPSTRARINLAKAQAEVRDGVILTHDELITRLLDKYEQEIAADAVPA
jgi:hypothetical protein